MSVLVFSANGQYVVKPDLATAVASADTVGRTIVVTSPITVGTVAVPATIGLRIEKGGVINVAGTLTINGPFYAGAYKVFTSSGAVKFSTLVLDTVYPQWWGAVGDNTNDDTTAIVSAIASISRTGTSDYFRASKVKFIPGVYKTTAAIQVPYGIGIEGDSPGNTLINVTGNGGTDGLVWDGSVTNAGAQMYNCYLKNITVNSNTTSTSRNLVFLNLCAEFRIDNVRVVGAGSYNIKFQDGVDVRGYHVMSSGAVAGCLWVGTAGSSVDTTTSFIDSTFSDATNGWGADVAGDGLSFINCIFEHNGVTDLASGGLRARQGHVTVTSCYFENNAGHNIIVGTDNFGGPEGPGTYTIINPHMTKNPAIGAITSYGLYINAGSVVLLGGNYSITPRSIYINNANNPVVHSFVETGGYPPTVSSGTIANVVGMQLFSAPSGQIYMSGAFAGINEQIGSLQNAAATMTVYQTVFHVTGATPIVNITPPYTGFTGEVCLIPDSAFTTTAAGNIAKASTAVINVPLRLKYDGTKWYPSY